jgi:hypothetical protein
MNTAHHKLCFEKESLIWLKNVFFNVDLGVEKPFMLPAARARDASCTNTENLC